MTRHAGKALLLGLILASLGACGDNGGNSSPQPGASPTPTASPSPSPSPTSGWSRIQTELNQTDIPVQCDNPFRFTVMSDGSFSAGPCRSGQSPRTGKLEASELDDLNTLVARVIADGGLDQAPDCTGSQPIGSGFVDLTTADGATHRVVSYGANQICFRGNASDLGDMAPFVIDLLDKYYPFP